MAKSDILYIPSKYLTFGAKLTSADETNLKILFDTPPDDANLIMLSITSTDLVERNLLLYSTINNIDYLLGQINVPASAGAIASEQAVSGLNFDNFPFLLVDDTGQNMFLPLKGDTTLKIRTNNEITPGTEINIVGVVADYTKEV